MAVYDTRRSDRMRSEPMIRQQPRRSARADGYRDAATDLPEIKPQPIQVTTEEIAAEHTCKPDEPPVKRQSGLFEELLGGGLDSEKLLIAALIFLLIKEGADMKLILALGYILL